MSFILGKLLWQEDDCAPDAASLSEAWEHIFAEKFASGEAKEKEDWGDTDVYLMPNGYFAVSSYRGNNRIHAAPTPEEIRKELARRLKEVRGWRMIDLTQRPSDIRTKLERIKGEVEEDFIASCLRYTEYVFAAEE